jgi:hypothetical protein
VEGKFKNRREKFLNLSVDVTGGIVTKDDNVAVWGGDQLVTVVDEEVAKQETVKKVVIK